MSESNAAIDVRLSAAQISVIWPGLKLLTSLYASRRHQYPFQLYPPPSGFDRGAFDLYAMDKITALSKRVRSIPMAGCRMQLDTIELRSAIFAIRAHRDFARMRRRHDRRSRLGRKAEPLIGDQSFDQLKIKSQRVILVLERHMRRANRTLGKSVSKDQYAALINMWTRHLRWMHLHIAYFKPLAKPIRGGRIRQQQNLNELMKMAERGLRNAGYQVSDSRELRRIMRLYVRSARRGREGKYSVRYLLNDRTNFTLTWNLAQFVLRRLTLEELKQP
jgi:hypothetical protein